MQHYGILQPGFWHWYSQDTVQFHHQFPHCCPFLATSTSHFTGLEINLVTCPESHCLKSSLTDTNVWALNCYGIAASVEILKTILCYNISRLLNLTSFNLFNISRTIIFQMVDSVIFTFKFNIWEPIIDKYLIITPLRDFKTWYYIK